MKYLKNNFKMERINIERTIEPLEDNIYQVVEFEVFEKNETDSDYLRTTTLFQGTLPECSLWITLNSNK